MSAVIDADVGHAYPIATPLRRLGALVSDSLIAVAVAMIATFPFLPLARGKALVPQEVGWLLAYGYRLWVALLLVGFFSFLWVRKGQTVGMQAWRVKVEREQGGLLNWSEAVRRCLWNVLPWLPAWLVLELSEHLQSDMLLWAGRALLVLGVAELLSGWWTADRRSWADRWSGSRVVVVPFAVRISPRKYF